MPTFVGPHEPGHSIAGRRSIRRHTQASPTHAVESRVHLHHIVSFGIWADLDIQLLGAVGEILAALGVFASLLYLARQVRAARSTLEADAVRSVNAAQRRTLATLAADPELARIVRIGAHDPQSLNGLDRSRLWYFAADSINQFQEAVLLHESGFMSPETFRPWQVYFGLMVQLPGFREYMTGAGALYDSRVIAALETADLPNSSLEELAPLHFAPMTDADLRARGRTSIDP